MKKLLLILLLILFSLILLSELHIIEWQPPLAGMGTPRTPWMRAIIIGAIIYKVIYWWAAKNPDKFQKLKRWVSRLDPTKPFRKP